MALTLGTTGMDRQTEAAVVAAFKAANAETGHLWSLVEGDEADYVVIDMDSLYGPMSWLRLHGMGRKVIGLTSVDRQQTDYRLPHPVSGNDLAVLLSEIVSDLGQQPSPEPDAVPHAAVPQPPAEATEPAAPHADAHLAVAPTPPPKPEPEPEPQPATPAEPLAPVTQTLREWLHPDRLRQRARLQRGEGPVLLVDAAAGVWHGPATLKPLIACFDGEFSEADITTPDAAAWNAEAGSAGPAQPLARLHWLGGLLSGDATSGRYLLKKWPQTEREYPKHFRIATVMMKGAASVDEIADASGVPAEEVAAFVNANLATGYAESVNPEPPGTATAATRSGGLFGRMRGH
ncbi:hypothetical protein [Thermomonas paludicola]|uniref:hypothetical protein n=1 Tax=Thermomonas paludicola TaxID=2884874 RepID=UPI002113F0A9|nr:hypothetical protein [Thermomonas paludicola]